VVNGEEYSRRNGISKQLRRGQQRRDNNKRREEEDEQQGKGSSWGWRPKKYAAMHI
jgi:hypothetical protein